MVCSIMCKVWLFVLLLSCNVKCVPTQVENWKEIDGNHRRGVAAFYNVYCEGPSYDGIVKDQITKMEMSCLMDKLDNVLTMSCLPQSKCTITHFLATQHIFSLRACIAPIRLLLDINIHPGYP